LEGLNDVKVILAIYESAESGQPVRISRPAPHVGPNGGMRKRVPGHAEPEVVNATGASS
jgi:hypothetical protein